MIIQKFTGKKIEDDLYNQFREEEEKFLKSCAYVAIGVVNRARDLGSYTDRTGKLRSSIGFKLYKNKDTFLKDFTGDNSEGIEESDTLADRFVKTKDATLIILTSTEYAIFVENRDYTVLSDFINLDKIKKEIEEMVND